MTGLDKRGGDHGTSCRPAGGVGQARVDLAPVDGRAEVIERSDDVDHAPAAIGALPFEKCRDHWIMRIEKIREHVHVATVVDRGDFDSRHDVQTSRRRGRRHGVDRGHRVVIGDGEERQPCGAASSTSPSGVDRPSDAVVWR